RKYWCGGGLMRKRFVIGTLSGVALVAWLALGTHRLAAQEAGQRADLILTNGKVLTVDNNFTIAEAVAVGGNKILAEGKAADIQKMAGSGTQVIDLKGKTVIPGLVDTHRHSYAYSEGAYGGLFGEEALHRYPVDWRGVRNKDDVLNQLKGLMAKYKFK